MISWNNIRIFLSLCCAFVSYVATAQTVSYYKLTKTKINGVISTNVSGGQFICFYDGVCFDSDKYGKGVGNGQLQLKSSNVTDVYYGRSYFGDGSYYKFDKDHNKLNIIAQNGDIYAYVRSVAPSGVVTCSLIRKYNNSAGYVENNHNGYNNPGIGSYPTYNNDNSVSSGNDNSSTNDTPQKRRCVYCNGTGQITKDDNAPTNFGITKPRKQCPTCGIWYDPNVFNHYHITCSHCGGSGFAK